MQFNYYDLGYLFTVVRARVVSQFDIETRGRVHVFEGIPLDGFGLQHVTIVERDGRPAAFMVSVEPQKVA